MIWDEESVIVIREAGFGADLDIFALGSRSDKIRFEGTRSSVSVSCGRLPVDGGHQALVLI